MKLYNSIQLCEVWGDHSGVAEDDADWFSNFWMMVIL